MQMQIKFKFKFKDLKSFCGEIDCDNSDDPTAATKSAVTSRAKASVGWEI